LEGATVPECSCGYGMASPRSSTPSQRKKTSKASSLFGDLREPPILGIPPEGPHPNFNLKLWLTALKWSILDLDLETVLWTQSSLLTHQAILSNMKKDWFDYFKRKDTPEEISVWTPEVSSAEIDECWSKCAPIRDFAIPKDLIPVRFQFGSVNSLGFYELEPDFHDLEHSAAELAAKANADMDVVESKGCNFLFLFILLGAAFARSFLNAVIPPGWI